MPATTPTVDPTLQPEEVREASAALASELASLAADLPRAARAASGMTEEDLRAIIESPATRLLVARDDAGRVVGMLTLVHYRLPTGIRAWIEDFAVAPDARRGGIGRRLTEEGIRLARETGALDVEMLVPPSRIAARHMVRGVGFGPDDEDSHRMRLT